MEPKDHIFTFGGGLDTVTPALKKNQSYCIAGENYEPRPDGYRRIDGHERYDGHTQPHLAKYYYLTFDAGQAAIAAGDIVAGATSAATAVALIDAVIETGSYAGSDATGYLVLTEVSGTFVDNENLTVSAAVKMVANGVAAESYAPTDALSMTWNAAAIELARSNIAAVPGSGSLRGAYRYNGVTYAFRDNVSATACEMYKSSIAGWVLIDKGKTLDFTAGTTEFSEGETVTGGTSAATATIERVVVTSGTWSGSDAAGYLVLSSDVGTFQAAEAITSAGGSATCSGAAAPITLEPGGKFEFINFNFFGATNLKRMYGVDGVSHAFEWDGTVFTPIRTGMVVDTPNHIAAHKNHLFLSFPGGSLQHSGVGTPLNWTLLLGAGELGIGDDVTGMLGEIAGVMPVYSRNKTHILYGSSSADWDLKGLSGEAGAQEWSPQEVAGEAVHIDINGVGNLQTTQNFGDFTLGRYSSHVHNWFEAKTKSSQKITATVRIKSSNQYRVFYSGGAGIIMDMSSSNSQSLASIYGKKFPAQFMPISYGKTVEFASSSEDDDGTEWILFGTSDGYVYRDHVGTSFDGASVPAFLRLAFNHTGTPAQKKRFFYMLLEMEASPNTIVAVAAEYDYGDVELPLQGAVDYDVVGGGGFWGEAFWNQFYWSAQIEGVARADLDGIGKNIGIMVASDLTYEDPHTLHGATIFYNYRGQAR